MIEKETGERPKGRPTRSRAQMRSDITVVVIVGAVMAILDYMSLKWFVPWADEMTTNKLMSLGFVVALFVTFCNVIIVLALVAYVLSEESYPHERWQ